MSKISKSKATEVCAFYTANDTDDISTERLLEMCRQAANLQDVSEVVDALKIGGMLKEVK